MRISSASSEDCSRSRAGLRRAASRRCGMSEPEPELVVEPEFVELAADDESGVGPPHKTRSAKHLRAMLSRAGAEPGSGSPGGDADEAADSE